MALIVDWKIRIEVGIRWAADRGWDGIVVNPSVGAGAHGAKCFRRDDRAVANMRAHGVLPSTDIMIQPFQSSGRPYEGDLIAPPSPSRPPSAGSRGIGQAGTAQSV